MQLKNQHAVMRCRRVAYGAARERLEAGTSGALWRAVTAARPHRTTAGAYRRISPTIFDERSPRLSFLLDSGRRRVMATSALDAAPASRPLDSLARYIEEIRRYPLLDRGQEGELARRSRDGDADARERLVCANLRFVVAVAKRYRNQGVSLSDLINEGNMGLIRAADRFDETRGVRFLSYAAWWVSDSMAQAVAENGHVVRIPEGRARLLRRIQRHAAALRQQLGREPTHRELAARLDLSEADVVNALPMARPSFSLDAPSSDGDDRTLLDQLSDEGHDGPDDMMTPELGDTIADALLTLPEREARVVRLHFGLDGNEPMTLEDIGSLLGVTRQRVRQIKETALSRIRKSTLAGVLASHDDG